MILALRQAHLPGLLALSESLKSDPSPCSYWSLDTERVAAWLSDQTRTDLVLLSRGTVAAVASLKQGGRHQHHLGEVSVAVHPEHRRSGHAAALIAEIENRARTTPIEILKAMIWVENQGSRKLFASLGYEHRATLMAEFKSDQIGEIDDAVYYKRL